MQEAEKFKIRVRIEAPAETAEKAVKKRETLPFLYYILLLLSYVFSLASLYLSFVL